ncbi:hypothetical protein RFI_32790 [Reticulomyxa filosa]|uniref:Uncharacterized protein n=1 Tax=Reticulomyxa filosa TaxID=46433 RepID=X6LSI4_RETFI|nr:hypothetical protein RFI_32790 [Reticulomyxa filosa]|eukprot:ETO04604.1 hypothetical protein RFI_32790 [Reticulomyxa filosa]
MTSVLCQKTLKCTPKPLFQIPLVSAMHKYFPLGYFPLLNYSDKVANIFNPSVVRPKEMEFACDQVLDKKANFQTMDQLIKSSEWCYYFEGAPSSCSIANKNPVDSIHLATHYALCDAVMLGSNSLMIESTPKHGWKGHYHYFQYLCEHWKHVLPFDNGIINVLSQQREYTQNQTGNPQLFSCNYFVNNEMGQEVFVVTSVRGAHNLSQAQPQNVKPFQIITLPPLTTQKEKLIDKQQIQSTSEHNNKNNNWKGDDTDQFIPEDMTMDLSVLPKLLIDKFDIRLVDLDGGWKVLRECAKQRIINQMTINLCKQSLRSVLGENAWKSIQLYTVQIPWKLALIYDFSKYDFFSGIFDPLSPSPQSDCQQL